MSEPLFNIVRFFAPTGGNEHAQKPNQIIKRDVTLEEAQRHCNDPSTKKRGEYFDGYTRVS